MTTSLVSMHIYGFIIKYAYASEEQRQSSDMTAVPLDCHRPCQTVAVAAGGASGVAFDTGRSSDNADRMVVRTDCRGAGWNLRLISPTPDDDGHAVRLSSCRGRHERRQEEEARASHGSARQRGRHAL